MLFVSAMWVGKNFLTVKMAKNFPPLHVNFFCCHDEKKICFFIMVSKAKNLLVLTSSSQKSANFAKDFGDRISPKEYNKNPKNSLQIRDRS